MGIIPDYEGLRIEPCLPKDIDEYKVERLFRNTDYEITVRKAKDNEEPGVWADGQKTEGPIPPNGSTIKVLVITG